MYVIKADIRYYENKIKSLQEEKKKFFEGNKSVLKELFDNYIIGPFVIRKYDKEIRAYESKITQLKQEKEKEEKLLDLINTMTMEEYSKLESELKERIDKHVKAGYCGCSRIDAKDFIMNYFRDENENFITTINNDLEAIIAYNPLKPKLFSYCNVTESSTDYRDESIELFLSLAQSSEVVVSKIKKTTDVTDKLLDTIESLVSVAADKARHDYDLVVSGEYKKLFYLLHGFYKGEYNFNKYKNYYETASNVFQRFAESLERASEEGRYYHAYRIAKIMKKFALNDEMNHVATELMKKYTKQAIHEILSDESTDMEFKRKRLEYISLSQKFMNEMYRFKEMTKKPTS